MISIARVPLATALVGLVVWAPLLFPADHASADVWNCTYPSSSTSDHWEPLPVPSSGASQVEQLDRDACELVAVDATGAAWRSRSGGAAWTPAKAPPLLNVLAESLQTGQARGLTGPVLATARASSQSPTETVWVSSDDGASYQASKLITPVGPVPFAGRVVAAASALRIDNGSRRADVFAVVRTHALDTAAADPDGSLLVRSGDGGLTFAAVQGAAGLSPRLVAIDPSAPQEIWVTDGREPAAGGGVWRSADGGASFSRVCCSDATQRVQDLAITSDSGGSIDVLLATSSGISRSIDLGLSWSLLTHAGAEAVRTTPDDPDTILAIVGGRALRVSGLTGGTSEVAGLPQTCGPSRLRRSRVVPATFVTACGIGSHFRLTLQRYRTAQPPGDGQPSTAPSAPPTGPPGLIHPPMAELPELATWRLPGSNASSGALAFDGVSLLYDKGHGQQLGAIEAATGRASGTLATPFDVDGLAFDLRRNQLLVTYFDRAYPSHPSGARNWSANRMIALDRSSGRVVWSSSAPYHVVSYDAKNDGLSWVEEGGDVLKHAKFGAPASETRDVCRFPSSVAQNGSPSGLAGVNASTFVAAGDGGGYLQDEDDRTLYRLTTDCGLTGWPHRTFSESTAENDAMACDTQTFFPVAAIWIRDSAPGTVTAYRVPFGYCPMPSRVILDAPSVSTPGSETAVCATLVNATTERPAVGRALVISSDNDVLGRATTDVHGTACVPYRAAPSGTSSPISKVSAQFAGDSALYSSSATAPLRLVRRVTSTTRRLPGPAALAPPGPPVAPLPVPPGVPAPAAATAPQPVPNAVQAPAGQAQPVAQGMVAPQRQQQLQLVFARAAAQVNVQPGDSTHPMTRFSQRGRNSALATCLLGCLISAGLTVVRQRSSIEGRRP